MKTNEFIKKVEEFGYKVLKSDSTLVVIKVISEKHSHIYGYVFNTDSHKIETTQYARQDPRLFNLMVEYARTPIDDREEPKKYYVKPKGIKVHRESVYHYVSIQKTWELLRKDIDYEWQNIFTLEELKELGVPIEHYDLEEVKE